MPDFNSFFQAIAGQESGGNYNAINPNSGALGKYQIMPQNVPGWSQQYLGVSWTPQQFLEDPSKQDALARAVLGGYYQQYGARGAAAAWYSGNPANANDYGSQSNGPSIGGYVDQVMARMTGHAAFTATQVLDNSATTKAQEQAMVNQPRENSGMGAVTQNGADTVTLDSMKAMGSPGSQAVGTVNPADMFGQSPNQANGPSQAGAGAPSNNYTVARSMRYFATKQGQSFLGVPYVWGGGGTEGPSTGSGGNGPIGFDCSGLVQYVLAQAGIKAPRLSYDQLAMGQRAAINSLLPGDLIGFGDGHHIAVWLGNGQILEAPHTGAAVRVRALDPSEDAWGVSLANLYH